MLRHPRHGGLVLLFTIALSGTMAPACADHPQTRDEPDVAVSGADSQDKGATDSAPDVSDVLHSAIEEAGVAGPIVLSTSLLSFDAACGGTPAPQSFTVTNVTRKAITWMAVVQGNYSIDVGEATLTPGGIARIMVTPSAVPQNPASTQVNSGTITITASSDGNIFSERLTLQLFAYTCIAPLSLPTSLDLGTVSIGAMVWTWVCGGTLGPTCYPQQQEGGGPWELSASSDPNFPLDGESTDELGNCYRIGFAPETEGQRAMILTWSMANARFCSPLTLVVKGAGVAADAAVTDAADADNEDIARASDASQAMP